ASVAHRRHSQDDRIVAVIQRLHVNDRLGPGAGRVVAGPFSERTLVARFHSGRGNRSGDDYLGGRGYGQPGYFLADDLDRLTAHVADQVVLAHAQLLAEEWGCAGEQDRLFPEGHRHRADLALGPVFPFDDGTGVIRRNVQPQACLVLDHHPVGAEIDLTGVRVAHDHHAAGTDVSATVELVPLGRGELP